MVTWLIQNINKYPVKHTKNGIKLGFIKIFVSEDKNDEEPKRRDVENLFSRALCIHYPKILIILK